MIIDVNYEVGVGGNVSVTKNNDFFDYEIIEFEENHDADIGVEVKGNKDSWIINDVYNRNALPNVEEVSSDEYDKIFNDIKSEIIRKIKNNIESFFENN